MYPNLELQELEKNNDKIDEKLLYLTLFIIMQIFLL
jgi:hypothetical protein